MPSLEWNRRFGLDLVRFSRRNPTDQFYGDQWGSVEDRDDLIAVRKKFLDPFVSSHKVCMEIGSGGGRWTQYLLPCRELICVELNPEMFDYIRNRFGDPKHVSYVTTNGHDVPSVPNDYVDFIFSFGTFVHLEMETIARYVESMSLVMKSGADLILQISNTNKEHSLAEKPSFSNNSPEFMVDTLSRHRLGVVDVDNDVLLHSTIIHGRKL
jgi:SAM-dependent methyltransferase